MGDVPARSRFSKQLAEEYIEVYGALAHLRALEELEGHRSILETKELWRDVLTWLDELGDSNGISKDRRRADLLEQRGEPFSGATCDSEANAEDSWRQGPHDGADGDERRQQQGQE